MNIRWQQTISQFPLNMGFFLGFVCNAVRDHNCLSDNQRQKHRPKVKRIEPFKRACTKLFKNKSHNSEHISCQDISCAEPVPQAWLITEVTVSGLTQIPSSL